MKLVIKLRKSRKFPVGTVRIWNGKKYRKISNDKWAEVFENKVHLHSSDVKGFGSGSDSDKKISRKVVGDFYNTTGIKVVDSSPINLRSEQFIGTVKQFLGYSLKDLQSVKDSIDKINKAFDVKRFLSMSRYNEMRLQFTEFHKESKVNGMYIEQIQTMFVGPQTLSTVPHEFGHHIFTVIQDIPDDMGYSFKDRFLRWCYIKDYHNKIINAIDNFSDLSDTAYFEYVKNRTNKFMHDVFTALHDAYESGMLGISEDTLNLVKNYLFNISTFIRLSHIMKSPIVLRSDRFVVAFSEREFREGIDFINLNGEKFPINAERLFDFINGMNELRQSGDSSDVSVSTQALNLMTQLERITGRGNFESDVDFSKFNLKEYHLNPQEIFAKVFARYVALKNNVKESDRKTLLNYYGDFDIDVNAEYNYYSDGTFKKLLEKYVPNSDEIIKSIMSFMKGKKFPEGTIRVWKGNKFKKVGKKWVKVSEGKVVNVTQRVPAILRKEFKDWFGDWEKRLGSKVVRPDGSPKETYHTSKVLDAEGKPKVVYHGTSKGGFTKFDITKCDSNALFGSGFYFTEDFDIAREYESKEISAVTLSSEQQDYLVNVLNELLFDTDIKIVREFGGARPVHSDGSKGKFLFSERNIYSTANVNYVPDTLLLSPKQRELWRSAAKSVGWVNDSVVETKEVYLNIRKPFDIDEHLVPMNKELAEKVYNSNGYKHSLRVFKDAKERFDSVKNKGTRLEIQEAETIYLSALATMKEYDFDIAMRYEVLSKSINENELNKYLMSLGYDGLTHIGGGRIKSDSKKHRVWIAWNPTQIKSVHAEKFDSKDEDIMKSKLVILSKGKKFTIGTVREWKGKKFIKTAKGWKPYTGGKNVGYELKQGEDRYKKDDQKGSGIPGDGVGTPDSARSDGRREYEDNAYEKDGIQLARSEYTRKASGNHIPESLRKILKEHQRDFVNLAIEKFESGEKSMLNMDGTGAGKTMQELSLAKTYLEKNPDKPVLIITQNDNIVEDAFKGDAKLLGINFDFVKGEAITKPGIYVTTYSSLGKYINNEFGLVVYDECHNMKNYASKKTDYGKDLMDKTDKVALFSATPLDKGEHTHYLAKAFGIAHGSMMEYLGFELKKYFMGGQERRVWQPFIDMKEVAVRLDALFTSLTESGLSVKREVSLDNLTMKIDQVNLDPDFIEKYNIAEQDMWDRIEDAEYFKKGLVKGQGLLAMRRFLETGKKDHALQEILKSLSENKSVVVFATQVNESKITGLDDPAIGTLKEISSELNKLGIEHVNVFGSDKQARKMIADFQNNDIKVILTTPQSGGTGLSLDDKTGRRPRKGIVLTPPFSAMDFVQMAGRINRLSTKSPAEITLLSSNVYTDRWNKSIIANKLTQLGGTVKGDYEKIDIHELDALSYMSESEAKEYFKNKENVGAGIGTFDFIPLKSLRDGSFTVDNTRKVDDRKKVGVKATTTPSPVQKQELKTEEAPKSSSSEGYSVGGYTSGDKVDWKKFIGGYTNHLVIKPDGTFLSTNKLPDIIIDFGEKHKGKYISEVQKEDPDYIKMILGKLPRSLDHVADKVEFVKSLGKAMAFPDGAIRRHNGKVVEKKQGLWIKVNHNKDVEGSSVKGSRKLFDALSRVNDGVYMKDVGEERTKLYNKLMKLGLVKWTHTGFEDDYVAELTDEGKSALLTANANSRHIERTEEERLIQESGLIF